MYVFGSKIGFVAHARTASRATGRLLESAGFDTSDGHHTLRHDKCKKIIESGGIIACTVRNPFDLFVSWYFNWHFRSDGTRKTAGTFEEWIASGFKCGYVLEYDPYFYGLEYANRVLRFETLKEDLYNLMDECWLEHDELEPIGVTPNRRSDYRIYYTEETRDIVQKRFAKDLELTGYEF